MTEVQESGTRKKIKLTYIVTAVAISCLMVGASLGIIISGTTPSIPTVIQPGSMIVGADYIVFKDGATYYARNGITGALTYQSTAISTVLSSIVTELNRGGVIYIHSGDYTLTTSFIIATPGIIIQGEGSKSIAFSATATKVTNIIGNVYVESENIKFKDLTITGNLTFTSTADKSEVAHYFTSYDLEVIGSIWIIGVSGANPTQTPFVLSFYAGDVTPAYDALTIQSTLTGGINHVYFYGTQFNQQVAGNAVKISGAVAHITFENCLFMVYHANAVAVNITGPGVVIDVVFSQCSFEMNPGVSDTVLFSIGAAMTATYDLNLMMMGGQILDGAALRYVVRDDTPSGETVHYLTFTNVKFYQMTDFRFRGAAWIPGVMVRFLNNEISHSATFTRVNNGSYVGQFDNNMLYNPRGVISTPFTGNGTVADHIHYYLSITSADTRAAHPTKGHYYNIRDIGMFVTSTGGANVSIYISDQDGNNIVSGATTLARTYLPYGYAIDWDTFTSYPTITVEGL